MQRSRQIAPATATTLHTGIESAGSFLALCLLALPLASGGYSGTGYLLAFTILPLTALVGVLVPGVPSQARYVLLLYWLSLPAIWFMQQPGQVLWFYLLALPCVWVAAWAMFMRCESVASKLVPAASLGAVASAAYGWFLWLGAGRVEYSITSTFGLHNAYAGYLLLAWPAAALAGLDARTVSARRLWGCTSVFLGATLVLTYSKAAAACLILQLLLLGLLLFANRGARVVQAARLSAVGVFLTGIGLLTLPSVRDAMAQVFDFGGYSMQGRLRFWSAAIDMFKDSPLIGVGLGSFGFAYPQYQRDWMYFSVDPHSWPLQLISELGVVGLFIGIAVAWGVLAWTSHLAKAGRDKDIMVQARLVLPGIAVLGSLAHAAFDFDYTFTATTALLGLMLAYGSWHARTSVQGTGKGTSDAAFVPDDRPGSERRERLLQVLIHAPLALLIILAGMLLAQERYELDRLREESLSVEERERALRRAIQFNPRNFRTHYQLAAQLSSNGAQEGRLEALDQVEQALALNPLFSRAWVLKGMLAQPRSSGGADIERGLELDPYNFPEHYYAWAGAAVDKKEMLRRLQIGMQRIPVDDPIPTDHIRPEWYQLNPLFGLWYEQMAQLTEVPREKEMYTARVKVFREFLKEEAQESESGN